MRRFFALLGGVAMATAAIAGVAVAEPVATNSSAKVCGADTGSSLGLLPTTTVAIGVHPNVVYIDDRDIIGRDVRGGSGATGTSNPEAGGLWAYSESGKAKGLQRGTMQVVFATLGTGDLSGGSFTDDCREKDGGTVSTYDHILF